MKQSYSRQDIISYLVNVMGLSESENLVGLNTMELLDLVDDPDAMNAYYASYPVKENI